MISTCLNVAASGWCQSSKVNVRLTAPINARQWSNDVLLLGWKMADAPPPGGIEGLS